MCSVCYFIVFISPAFWTLWLGVQGPAGCNPTPSLHRRARVRRDLVTPCVIPCSRSLLPTSTSSRLSPARAVHVCVCREPRWRGRADAALCPQSSLGPPAPAFLPGPWGWTWPAHLSAHLTQSVRCWLVVKAVNSEGAPSAQGSCLQSRLALSVLSLLRLRWGGTPPPRRPVPRLSLGRA